MATLIVNDNERRVEYSAAPSENTFAYPWEIFVDGDLDVFKDEVQLVLFTDYTVTNAGVTGGGDIILVVDTLGGENIVISSDIVIDQTVDFTIKSNFTGSTIQTQFNKLTMIAQDLDTKLNQRGLLYPVFDDLKIDRQDNVLPTLLADQFWKMNATATGITAASFEVDPGANTLRSELISTASGSDGAKIVGYFSEALGGTLLNSYLDRLESKTNGADGASILGYFDTGLSTETTIKEKLDALSTSIVQENKNIIIGGDFTTNPFQRGTIFNPIVGFQFVADRFEYQQAGSEVLKSSVETTAPPTVVEAGIFINKYIRFEVVTAASLGVSDFLLVRQSIEGFNWTRIAQRSFTISFWVRGSITGTFAVSFRNVDQTLSYVSTYTIDSENTWEKKSITVSASPVAGNWNFENGKGVEVDFTMGAGTNFQTASLNSWIPGSFLGSTTQTNLAGTIANTFDLALIQVEEGLVATSFEVRHFQQELALCQRYFYKTYSQNIAPTTITNEGVLIKVVQSGSIGQFDESIKIDVPVRLRKAPTGVEIVAFSNVTGAPGIRNITNNVDISASQEQGGELANFIRPENQGLGAGTALSAHVTIDVEILT